MFMNLTIRLSSGEDKPILINSRSIESVSVTDEYDTVITMASGRAHIVLEDYIGIMDALDPSKL